MPRIIPELAVQSAASLPPPASVPHQLRAYAGGIWYSTGVAWVSLGAGQTAVPTYLKAGETYVVPECTQVLWSLPIELGEGATLEVCGDFVEVM